MSRMERYITTDAVVLKEVDFGESSKMLTAFSGEYGLLRISAKGVRRPKSASRASAQMFCYSRFELYRRTGDVYTMTGAKVQDAFYGLGSDLDAFFVAGRMAGVLLKVLQPELSDPDTMRLLLNCLYYLSTGKRSARYIQVVFMLRLLALQGFLPESEIIPELLPFPVSQGTVQALSHIAQTDMESLFRFGVSDTILEELEKVSDRMEREYL